MLDASGNVKIADFGLSVRAQAVGELLTRPSDHRDHGSRSANGRTPDSRLI